MQFTLDSIEHLKASLEERYKEKFEYIPVIYHDLAEIPPQLGGRLYYLFGVLTVGGTYSDDNGTTQKKIGNAHLINEGFTTISVEPDSQIVDFFRVIAFTDENNNLMNLSASNIITIGGQFRGFLIYPKHS